MLCAARLLEHQLTQPNCHSMIVHFGAPNLLVGDCLGKCKFQRTTSDTRNALRCDISRCCRGADGAPDWFRVSVPMLTTTSPSMFMSRWLLSDDLRGCNIRRITMVGTDPGCSTYRRHWTSDGARLLILRHWRHYARRVAIQKAASQSLERYVPPDIVRRIVDLV